MKSKITISKKLFAFLIFSLLSISATFAQTFPPANTSCTSGDLTLVGATLSGGDLCNSCPTATSITRTLTLSINNTTGSLRTSFAFWGNLEVYSGTTGLLISNTPITGCNGPLPPNTITSLSYNTVTYNCGDILRITNLFLAWTSASPGATCPLDPNDISPKCGTLPVILVNGGVNGEFVSTDSQCGSANGALNLTPIFGTAPYTYSWSATGGGVVPVGQQNNQDLTGLLPGTYSVIITDANGCSITKTRVIGSSTAPVAAFANTSNITVPCGSATTSSLSYTNGASGSCLISGNVTSTLSAQTSTNPSSPACGGTIIETWTFTDALGRTITTSRTITVSPAAVATMTAPANITVACGSLPSPSTLSFTNGLSGGCLISGTSNPSTFSTAPSSCGGTVTETWTATDSCGRTIAPVSRTITVSPATLPTMTAPANTTVACGSLPAPSTISFTNGLSGGCLISGTSNPSTFTTAPSSCGGTVTETWTATDSCGRALAPVSRTITVSPAALPTMTAPANLSVACGALPTPSTISFTNGLSGGCLVSGTSNLSTFSTTTSGVCNGLVTETWTATDSCGRPLASVSRTISINDTTAPVIAALPAPSTISCPATPSFATATATDNCGTVASLTFDDVTTNGACAGSYSVTRTWTATDACGNSSTASQTINVTDTTAPVIAALPATSTISCPATPQFAQATATDACGSGATLTFDDVTTNGACAGSYSVTRTWTATDACGNSSTASQTINVTDTTAPVIAALPATSTISCPATPQFAQATATDACGSGATLTFDDVTTNGACAGSYSVTRTWTAVDACGNSSTASQTINVTDTTAPVIAALPTTSTISCPATPQFAQATATDACGSGATLTFDDVTTNGACAGSYSVTRTWTAVDACGNSSTASQTINVTDTTAPVIAALPATSTISCPATPQFAQATATDACGSGATLTFDDVTTNGACAGSYSVTRTWTAVDACGNSSTASQTINVTDTTAPVIAALPATSTISCPATPQFAQATATDACGSGATLTFNDVTTNGACAGSYSVTRTWTAVDACGNSSTASQTINVTDTTAPVIAALPATSTISCPATPQFAQATATDACGSGATLTFDDVTTNGACAGSYSVTRTWTAVDACGNSSTASQTINVTDTTAPVIAALPATSTISCPATPQFAQATATDACGSGATLTFDDVTTNGACAGSYSVTRTWTAVDACGNSSTASQTINVQDITAPVIAALPATSTIDCPATPSFATATASDACGSDFTLTFEDTTNNGSCAGNYSVTRTWTATDVCGNTSTASQTINVRDITAPTFTVPADVIINAGANCATDLDPGAIGTVTNISDACDATPTVTFTDSDCFGNDNGGSINAGNGNYFYFDVTGFDNLTAKDIEKVALAFETNQGKGRAEFTLVAPNGTAVILVGPYCTGGACEDANSSDEELYLPVFYPNSSGHTQWNNNNVITQDIPQNFTPNGALSSPNTVTGLTSYVSSFENLTGPMNGTWFIFSRKQASVNGSIQFNSVCLTPASACASNRVITRTWTVTDDCGNATSATQTIKIQDITAPVIATLPAVSTINCPATPEFAQATATDNCDTDVALTFVDATTNGACAGSYSVTRTWTATDDCGNTSTATQTINVQDITAPVIAALPAASTINCPAAPEFAQATATDECGSTFTLTSEDVTTNGACAGSYSVTRTWTATDACGNTSTASQTINVQDVTAPVIAALPAASTISCPAAPEFAQATATDECGSTFTLTSEDVTTNGACAGSYSVTRTWTATDACGNTSTASQTINVQDVTAPVIAALPAASTISCPAAPEFAQATATDECGSTFTLTSEDVTTNGACAGSYSVTRTWTATDACGNTSTASQTINVQDVTAPVIAALPAASTISCPAAPEFAQATATDECGSTFTLTSEDVTTNGACAGSYSVTRTWTATDACGNTSTASQTINVQDVTAPVIAALPAASTINCPAAPEFAQATATDECGSAFTLTSEDVTTNGACAGSYSVTRTWTATDACGNTSTASQTINVQDVTAPVIAALPAASTINCPATPEFAQATATDECGSAFTLTSEDVTTNTNCAGNYSVTRTWTATDACGNTSTASQTINVQDITAPIITAQASNIVVECDGNGNELALFTWLTTNGGATATDECSAVTWSNNFSEIANDCSAAVTVTFTATDECGNASSTSATFSINDTQNPVAPEAPAAVTVACAADVPANVSLTATDNCSNVITAQGVDATTPGECANSFTVVRTWTFTDACGNSSSVSQTIIVNDNLAPVTPEAPAAVTVACAADVPANVSLTAIDNCNGAITVEGVDVTTPGECANSFTTVRTWTFTDVCGNSSSVSQTITVNDNLAPVTPEAPAAVTVACAADVPANVSLTATDNCNGAITVEGVDVTTQGECANSFTTVRTWTFTDVCGNSSSVSQTITVNDNLAPETPEAPAAVTVACAADVPANVSLTAIDNCNGAITVEGVDVTTPGQCANSFTTVRTWTFTDVCGNSSSVSQTITVNDNLAPVTPEAPAAVTVACAADVPANVSLTAIDNCNGAITAQGVDVTTPGECANSFTTVRTWTFTDVCGNSSSVSQTITVNDNLAPVTPEAPAAVTVACADDAPANVSLTAIDNCNGAITVEGVDATTPGECANSFAIVRTWTFTDVCGNSSSVSQTINVLDNVAPVAPEAPAAVTVACAADVPANVSLTATDNCAGEITAQGVDVTTPGECANSFTTVRTWTFTDVCGNSSSVSQTITVNDNLAPVTPEAPAAVTVACAADVPANVSLTAIDNCNGAITVEGVDVTTPGECANSFTTVRTWTFTDVCGNSSSVSQTITVNDNLAPVTPEAPAAVTVACAADVPANVSLTAIDNCNGAITVEGVDVTTPGQCANSFTTVRTWTFTDVCGNSSSVSQTINVLDDVAPVAPEAPANITLACSGDVPAMISLTATDNCGDLITVEGVDTTTPGNCPNTFNTIRTWTFTDACGNSSSVSQTINVNDNVAPVTPEAPANVTVACAGDVPATTSLTAVDNCSGPITAQGVDTMTPGNCPNSFTITRTWTFTDTCGNSSSVSQTITVNDNVAPTFVQVAPANTTASCDNIPAPAVLTAIDNCGTANVTLNETIIQGNCPSNYQIVRTWTATDACGNTTTAVQTIAVSDTVGPVLVTPLPPKVDATCDDIPPVPVLVFTDNCSGTVTTPEPTITVSSVVDGSYTITRTWVATDACGNLSQTYTQFVFVAQTAEVITLPSLQLSSGDDVETSLDALLPAGVSGGTWINVDNVTPGFDPINNTFNPFEVAPGEYLFSYVIEIDGECPIRYNVLIIIGAVEDCENIIIHNAFTPNGDSYNQYFSIENIEDTVCYPTNNVQIYNRWGVLVYETKDYDNNTRRFEGISEGRVTVSKSEELPTGTYFYIIEWTTTEGNKVVKDGYLYLTR